MTPDHHKTQNQIGLVECPPEQKEARLIVIHCPTEHPESDPAVITTRLFGGCLFRHLRQELPDSLSDGLVQHHLQLAGILLTGNVELQVALLQERRLPSFDLQTLVNLQQGRV